MPDTRRPPDLSALTPGELERTRRDLAAALAPARPGSSARYPISTHLAAIDAELATKTSRRQAGARPHTAATGIHQTHHRAEAGT